MELDRRGVGNQVSSSTSFSPYLGRVHHIDRAWRKVDFSTPFSDVSHINNISII